MNRQRRGGGGGGGGGQRGSSHHGGRPNGGQGPSGPSQRLLSQQQAELECYAQQQDEQLSVDLDHFLRCRGDVYESPEGEEQRRDIIEKLHAILCRWIDGVAFQRNLPNPNPGNGAGAQLKIFGSTRLGVHTPDADIDVLCIAPSWISRRDFFSLFVDTLRERYDVSMVSAVPEAFTPVVKFVIDGQPIDMIFVSLPFHAAIPPDLDILSPSILRGLDDAAVRSINGSRVAERLLTLVPHFPTFATTLRAVKFWAREHSVYSNVLGFLGGVNYAILVCKLCQMHPRASPMTLLANFYSLYCQWPWPQCVAVAPYESIDCANVGSSGEALPGAVRPGQDWTPLSPASRYQLMPILTPCYPSMNSAYNVGVPQFRVIYEELRQSAGLFHAWYRENRSGRRLALPRNAQAADSLPVMVETGGGEGAHDKENIASASNAGRLIAVEPLALPYEPFPFDRLFHSASHRGATPAFFTRYPQYLEVSIQASSASDHRSWFGFIESRIRSLIINIERPELGLFTHPQSNCYHVVGNGATAAPREGQAGAEESPSSYASPLKRPTLSGGSLAVATPTHAPANETENSYTTAFYIGITFQPPLGLPEPPPLETLVLSSSAVLDLRYRISTWPGLQPSHKIAFSLLSYAQLPDYIHINRPEPSNMQTCTPGKRGRDTPRDDRGCEGRGRGRATPSAEEAASLEAARTGLFCETEGAGLSVSMSLGSSIGSVGSVGSEGSSQETRGGSSRTWSATREAGRSGALQFDLRSPTHLARRNSAEYEAYGRAREAREEDGEEGEGPVGLYRVVGAIEERAEGSSVGLDLVSRLGLGIGACETICSGGIDVSNCANTDDVPVVRCRNDAVSDRRGEPSSCNPAEAGSDGPRVSTTERSTPNTDGSIRGRNGVNGARPKATHKPKTKDKSLKGIGHGSNTSAAQAKAKEDQYLARRSHSAEGSAPHLKTKATKGPSGGVNVSPGAKEGGKIAWGTTSFAQVVSGNM